MPDWASGRSASPSTNCAPFLDASRGRGDRKYTAVRAALRGGWITALVTDIATARRLMDEP
ncbi:sugar-binding domain-containing protein [Streptomyces sp. ME02-7008A-1]|nr:sugar-binding domain-containing protein [Streptomyces sp. ME02-7008A-1]MDX3186626.1 sugar-binding domain-containing protein [Streptomyces sp. ME02-7008A-1]